MSLAHSWTSGIAKHTQGEGEGRGGKGREGEGRGGREGKGREGVASREASHYPLLSLFMTSAMQLRFNPTSFVP